MRNFKGLNEEIKFARKAVKRFKDPTTTNYGLWRFRLYLLTYWKEKQLGLPKNCKALWGVNSRNFKTWNRRCFAEELQRRTDAGQFSK